MAILVKTKKRVFYYIFPSTYVNEYAMIIDYDTKRTRNLCICVIHC